MFQAHPPVHQALLKVNLSTIVESTIILKDISITLNIILNIVLFQAVLQVLQALLILNPNIINIMDIMVKPIT